MSDNEGNWVYNCRRWESSCTSQSWQRQTIKPPTKQTASYLAKVTQSATHPTTRSFIYFLSLTHSLSDATKGSRGKLQALVYDILPSTTAVFSYAIGSRKLSANEQFFVGAQTAVSLLQTTQIKQSVSFIAADKVYTSTNKTTIVWIETELFFTRGGCVSCLRACFGARLLLQSY